ncbi:unnamed protein product [Cylindrotheca closterium]|uniref:Uncharacterized protein n=1 Tax=Cylindrotheca closterium TaxID=2856 RepID=A0AAD2G744_9STRA|nr:unnamed protein product [Cylindrotheca closterium]
MEVLVADGAEDADGLEMHPSSSSSSGLSKKLTPRARFILAAFGLFLVCVVTSLWNSETTGDEVLANMYTKPPDAILDVENNKYDVVVDERVESNATEETGFHEGVLNSSNIISINEESDVEELISPPLPDTPVTSDTGECSALCDSRDEARKQKFGGDLLDFSDVLRLAEKGRANLHDKLKEDYGQYFESIFIKEPGPNATKDSPPTYQGMTPITENGPSRNNFKRKLKIKVLKMMESIKISDENVHGCNCLTKTGSTAENEESFAADIPDYYQKYVFANGGHSSSAGHGNTFSQTYTAYMGEDLRFVWDAIAVEMVDRNMGMGAMSACPHISSCSKEIFGDDVDFLAYNYAMTDRFPSSWLHYVYRASVSSGRPAFVAIEYMGHIMYGPVLEDNGLSIFQLRSHDAPLIQNIPDSSPDGIELNAAQTNQLPEFAKHLKCNGRIEGKDVCFHDKWKCTMGKLPCDCPSVAKRSSWHPGYKEHALTGHFLALPVVEMLIESISDLMTMDKDPMTVLQDLQKEEDLAYKNFFTIPVQDTLTPGIDRKGKLIGTLTERFIEPLGEEMEYFFKGPSICRTALLPSMTRYLGIATNSDKVGGSARCGEETYDLGIPFDRNNGVYTYTSNRTVPPGEWAIMSPNDMRSCNDDCSDVVMPDYKDWYMGNWSSGSASITFPNKKEKEYYAYSPEKFKGILALMTTFYQETTGRKQNKRKYDIAGENFQENVLMTVNGEPVKKYRSVDGLLILEGPDGIYWKPSKNNDYVMEFKPKGKIDGKDAIEMHLRLSGFLVM